MKPKKIAILLLSLAIVFFLWRLFPLVIRFVEAAALSIRVFGRVLLGLALVGLVGWFFFKKKRNDHIIDR